MTGICRECQHEFTRDTPNRVYCSVECRKLTANRRQRFAAPRVDLPVLEGAACVGHDPELWFRREHADEAAAICAGCPARAECDAYADAAPIKYGMWGGNARRLTATYAESQ